MIVLCKKWNKKKHKKNIKNMKKSKKHEKKTLKIINLKILYLYNILRWFFMNVLSVIITLV